MYVSYFFSKRKIWAGSYLLSVFAVDSNSVESIAFFNFFDNFFCSAGDLVHLDDGVQPPVGHVQLVGVDDQGEGVANHSWAVKIYQLTN